MRNLASARHTAPLHTAHFETELLLTAAERRHVALAALQIQEQRHRLKLAQIAVERRALLAAESTELCAL
jgi:hypothetical protein